MHQDIVRNLPAHAPEPVPDGPGEQRQDLGPGRSETDGCGDGFASELIMRW